MPTKNSVVAAMPLLLIACASPVKAHQRTATHFSFGHASPEATATRTIKIGAYDLYFKPKHIIVHPGQTIHFVITNHGRLTHEFVIGDAAEQRRHEREMRMMKGMAGMSMNQARDPNGVVVPPGKTRSLTWTFDRTGVVQYACHEGHHFAAGMIGQIRVTHTSADRAGVVPSPIRGKE